MSHEALNKFRLPKGARGSRKLMLAVLLTSGALASTPTSGHAGNDFLDDLALGIGKGRAVQNGLERGGNLTVKCREPGDPLVETNSNSSYGYFGRYGNNTIYLPRDHPDCQDE